MATTYPHIGSLNRKITIQSSSYTTKQDTGERILTWATFKEVFANVSDNSTSEELEAGKVTATLGTAFTIRFLSGVTSKMRILYNSEYYNIRGTLEIGRRRFLTIKTDKLS